MGVSLLSLIIPCYNEEDSLPELLPKLDAANATLVAAGLTVEMILVDVGCRD
jgi:glycosyltransferase involved in cell wall biosynthesis